MKIKFIILLIFTLFLYTYADTVDYGDLYQKEKIEKRIVVKWNKEWKDEGEEYLYFDDIKKQYYLKILDVVSRKDQFKVLVITEPVRDEIYDYIDFHTKFKKLPPTYIYLPPEKHEAYTKFRVCISYIKDRSPGVHYNALQKGITDLLIRDLTTAQLYGDRKVLNIIQRKNWEKSLRDKYHTDTHPIIDYNSEIKLAKEEFDADILIRGFYIVKGDTLFIELKLIDLRSTNLKVVRTVALDDNVKNILDIEKKIVKSLLSIFKVVMADRNIYLRNTVVDRIYKKPTNSIDALNDYYNGIHYQDLAEYIRMKKNYKKYYNLYRLAIKPETALMSSYNDTRITSYVEKGISEFKNRTELYHNSLLKSKDYYISSLKSDPNFIYPMQSLGLIYQYLGINDSAEKYYKKALRIYPGSFRTNYNLGIVYYKNSWFYEAIKYFRKAKKIDPSAPEVYYNLGVCYYNLGSLKTALRQFSIVLNNPLVKNKEKYFNLKNDTILLVNHIKEEIKSNKIMSEIK